MTKEAQNALRRGNNNSMTCYIHFIFLVIEKYTENVRFCLICNYLSKIIPALQSRCTRFRFGPLTSDQMSSQLQHVINQEK